MRVLGLLITVLLLGACGDDGTFPCIPPPAAGPVPTPLVTAGAEAQVALPVLPSTPICSMAQQQEARQQPTAAQVELLDPAGRPVAHSVAFSRNVEPYATVSFMPPVPGVYSLRVRFEPHGSEIQALPHAALPVTSTPGPTLDVKCTQLWQLPSGALVCDRRVLREGRIVQRLTTGAPLTVAGGTVWTVTPDEVVRYEDTPQGALREAGRLAIAGLTFPVELMATQAELLLKAQSSAGVPSLRHVALREGTLTLEGERHDPALPFGSLVGLQRTEAGGFVWLAPSREYGTHRHPTAPLAACPIALDSPTLPPAGPCHPLPAPVLSADAGQLWVSILEDDGYQSLLRYVAEGPALRQAGRLRLRVGPREPRLPSSGVEPIPGLLPNFLYVRYGDAEPLGESGFVPVVDPAMPGGLWLRGLPSPLPFARETLAWEHVGPSADLTRVVGLAP